MSLFYKIVTYMVNLEIELKLPGFKHNYPDFSILYLKLHDCSMFQSNYPTFSNATKISDVSMFLMLDGHLK